MKTALVCGAGGFIGSHMVKRLKKEGWKWRDGEKHLDYFWDKDKKGCEEKTSELTDECDVKKKPLKRTRT